MVHFGRRRLLATGSLALTAPVLAGLRRMATAQGAPAPVPRRMIVLTTEHGGVWNRWMYPEEFLPREVLPHPLHDAHAGSLSARLEGDERVVSAVLRAPADRLTPRLLGKMNLLRGLDVPFYYGHARHVLGNYGTASSDSNDGPPDRETADQLLARTSLYAATPRRRTLYFANRGLSLGLVDPERGPEAGYQYLAQQSPQAIFDAVFTAPRDAGEHARLPPLDAVLRSYDRLASGGFRAGQRLASADRERLALMMAQLRELREAQRAVIGARCAEVMPRVDLPRDTPHSPYGPANFAAINDVIVTAFLCDASRLAVVRSEDGWHDGMDAHGGFHEVAHAAASRADAPTATRFGEMVRDGKQRFFADAFLDLIGKLDAIPEGEGTMLDHTLVWWTQEAGPETHIGDSIPIVTAGSARGRFITGRYADYRDRNVRVLSDEDEVLGHVGRRRGACFFQWTTTYLDAFDVPREAWASDDRVAYTAMAPNEGGLTRYDRAAMDASCAAPLPGLLA
ncbi:MAG: DUF1552 domain-containing protein [Myxococcota bacterium]